MDIDRGTGWGIDTDIELAQAERIEMNIERGAR